MFQTIIRRIHLVRAAVPTYAKEVIDAHRQLQRDAAPTKKRNGALKVFAAVFVGSVIVLLIWLVAI